MGHAQLKAQFTYEPMKSDTNAHLPTLCYIQKNSFLSNVPHIIYPSQLSIGIEL